MLFRFHSCCGSTFSGAHSGQCFLSVLSGLRLGYGVHGVPGNPFSYLTAPLTSIVNGHEQSQLDELIPWNYSGDHTVDTLGQFEADDRNLDRMCPASIPAGSFKVSIFDSRSGVGHRYSSLHEKPCGDLERGSELNHKIDSGHSDIVTYPAYGKSREANLLFKIANFVFLAKSNEKSVCCSLA
jgi:hypothetical protein